MEQKCCAKLACNWFKQNSDSAHWNRITMPSWDSVITQLKKKNTQQSDSAQWNRITVPILPGIQPSAENEYLWRQYAAAWRGGVWHLSMKETTTSTHPLASNIQLHWSTANEYLGRQNAAAWKMWGQWRKRLLAQTSQLSLLTTGEPLSKRRGRPIF